MSWTSQRARVAALSRSRPTSDPTLIEARERLRSERRVALADEYIAKLVADAPPLTDAQRDRLALLLRGGTAEAGGAAA